MRVEMEALDPRTLLAQARRGDADAFCELCRSHETRLLRQAITLGCNVSLAEELAQDTLVEAWKCLPRYNERCQFFTWLCAILLNRHRNSLRRHRTMPLAGPAFPNQSEFPDCLDRLPGDVPSPDEAAQRREQAALVHDCIRALPQKQREVIHLRFYVDDSLDGIAAALGCSVGTVKSRLFHALEKLRGMNALREYLANPGTKSEVL